MHTRRIALAFAAAVLAISSGGLLVALSSASSTGVGDPVPGPVASGVTPSGVPYSIDSVDRGQGVCLEVRAQRLNGGICAPEGPTAAFEVGEVLLGEDMFVFGVGKGEAAALRVRRDDGRGEATSSREVSLGDSRMLLAVMRTPAATLPTTQLGLPVPPTATVEVLGGDGSVLQARTLAAPTEAGRDAHSVGRDAHLVPEG